MNSNVETKDQSNTLLHFTSLERVMISGKKLTFNFSTFPLPPNLALVLSMVKMRPETPRFRCCTCTCDNREEPHQFTTKNLIKAWPSDSTLS